MRLLPRLSFAVALAVVATGCVGGTVFSLEAGECFQDAAAGTEQVTDVETVDCDEPHDLEVFHTFQLEGDELPDEATVVAAIEEECLGSTFEDYIGEPYETSEVDVTWLSPTEESWEEADDREVVCAAGVPGERIEGSLQGSGR